MNKWTELEMLKKTLKEVLMSDELDTTLYYLDEFKRLKIENEQIKKDIKNIKFNLEQINASIKYRILKEE